jgi:hypothetical protein
VALALTVWWTVGWIVGLAVITVAALLLLLVIGLARQIARQADDIAAALDGARTNTDALFEVTDTNVAVDRITQRLRSAREGEAL